MVGRWCKSCGVLRWTLLVERGDERMERTNKGVGRMQH